MQNKYGGGERDHACFNVRFVCFLRVVITMDDAVKTARIDKILAGSGLLSRSEAKIEIKRGNIKINGVTVKNPEEKYPVDCIVYFKDKAINTEKFTYLMMNKPDGIVCSTDDGGTTVIDLLDDVNKRKNLFPAGRLDKNTLGLVLLTNDGKLSHYLLSPKNNIKKIYAFRCEKIISAQAHEKLEAGVNIGNNIISKKSEVKLNENRISGEISITEGKFHQIKRMFLAVDNKIISLERIFFAGLQLDKALERGHYRALSDSELTILKMNELYTTDTID